MILKIRVNDADLTAAKATESEQKDGGSGRPTSTNKPKAAKKQKKMTKAAKKAERAARIAVASSTLLFDNAEEALLFEEAAASEVVMLNKQTKVNIPIYNGARLGDRQPGIKF